jgi:hypothetical protein
LCDKVSITGKNGTRERDMWEPTGKKATDKATGAKLVEQRMTTQTDSLRWEVSLNGEVLGYVDSYLGYVDKKAPGSRIVHSRKQKTMWSYVKVRKEGMAYQRTEFRNATRARAVYCLVNY